MKKPILGGARGATSIATLAAMFAAALFATASGASTLPPGTTITGSVSGASTELLGLDSSYASGPSSHITVLSDLDLEYLTGDFALGIDFSSSGLLTVYNNSGSNLLPGDYSLTFEFAALPDALASFALVDISALSGGSISATRLNANAIRLDLTAVSIAGDFGSFTAQVSAVPEPGSLVLTLAGLAVIAAFGRRCARSGAAQ